jgi:hydrogenase maturation protease
MTPRILIAGIGNIFLGDDAFGVEVVHRLASRCWPPGVRVVDFGIRGIDLTYALLDSCDVAILVDAVCRGQAPGTVYVIEPQIHSTSSGQAPVDLVGQCQPLIEPHDLDPAKVLRVVASLGGHVQRVILVGCEPTPFDPQQDMQMEMSQPVRAAVDEAATVVESLVTRLLDENAPAGRHLPLQGAGGNIQPEGAALCHD